MQVFEGKLRDKWKEMQANHNILYHIKPYHIIPYQTTVANSRYAEGDASKLYFMSCFRLDSNLEYRNCGEFKISGRRCKQSFPVLLLLPRYCLHSYNVNITLYQITHFLKCFVLCLIWRVKDGLGPNHWGGSDIREEISKLYLSRRR